MNRLETRKALGLALALLAVACGGSGDDGTGSGGGSGSGGSSGSSGGNGGGGSTPGKCSAPFIDGSTFGMLGTATVHGNGVLPAGLPDGYRFELTLDDHGFTSGVASAAFKSSPDTCGQRFSYKIVAVEPGTYKLGYELYAHDSDPDPKYHGTSTNEFTLTDGASVAFDPTF
ncbi:MAG TPA: hypothetical protein VFV94_02445 [Polyangiaceae bacterium]|nr:hypothetical protein [Polyangiaceae bacterium]